MNFKDTNEKIRYVLSQIFSPEWAGKEMKITIASEGPRPKKGRKYIVIYKYPGLGLVSKKELPELIEEWRNRVEPFLIHANHIWYRTSTRGGASKLYLLYDENL